MTKTKINIEKFGKNVRLMLPLDSNQIAFNQFKNLAWGCGEIGYQFQGEMFFFTTAKRFAAIVKAFRSNMRFITKNKNQNAPFEFHVTPQFGNNTHEFTPIEYKVGEYNDEVLTWKGYRPGIQKYFDAVQA